MSARRSVRFSLTLWYLGVLSLGMAVFAGSTWWVLRQVMLSNREQDLDRRLKALERFIEQESRRDDLTGIREEAREYATGLPAGQGLHIWDSSDGLLFEREADGRELIRRSRRFNVRGHSIRAELSVPLEGFDRTLSTLGWVMAALFPAVFAIAALGGWWLSRRALSPVDKMTREARSIHTRDLKARLSVPETGDELQRLAQAWNELLSRIEASVRSVNRFTADAAHELRTPVAVIRISADLAVRQERSPESYRRTLRTIQQESERMAELVDHLLLLAHSDAGRRPFRFDAVLIGAVVGRLKDALSPLAEAKGIRLDWSLPKRDGLVWADEGALRRLLLILVDNAVKFTPGGGQVSIRLEVDAERCILEVQDTGCGISPEHLPHVFERFYRADPGRTVGEGAGLGLAIARTIVDAHQGTLEAMSEAGGGSLFRVVLPSLASREIAQSQQ